MSRRAGFWRGFWFASFVAFALFNVAEMAVSIGDGNAGWAVEHALASCGFALFACLEWARE